MNVGVIGAGIISEIYLHNMINLFPNLNVIAIAAKHLERAQNRPAHFRILACTV